MIIEPEFMESTSQLDVQAFQEENEPCQEFTTNKPRPAAYFSPDDHSLFDFFSIPSTFHYYYDQAYRDDLHRRANALTEAYIGQAFFDEDTWEHSPRRIENRFGCEFEYLERGTPWLVPAEAEPDEFARIVDRAAETDIASWAFPDEYLAEWQARRSRGQTLPALGDGSRGPAMVITSILGVEKAFFWFPALVARYRDVLAERMVELNQRLREFSGNHQAG